MKSQIEQECNEMHCKKSKVNKGGDMKMNYLDGRIRYYKCISVDILIHWTS
jgi:hypothetical protein